LFFHLISCPHSVSIDSRRLIGFSTQEQVYQAASSNSFLVEGVASCGRLTDQFEDFGFVVEGHFHPHVFHGVGDLAEEFMDRLQAL
jgi:hypothetical protein